VNTIATYLYFTQSSFQEWARIVEVHRSIIFLLSFTIAGFTSVMMWLASRRIRSEKWMLYFSWSFLLLSAQYLLLFVLWYNTAHPPPIVEGHGPEPALVVLLKLLLLPLLSIANNLFGVAAARDIENQTPVLPRWSWLLAGGALLMFIIGNLPRVEWLSTLFQSPYSAHPLFYETIGRSLDAVFSAICLFLIGRAIFSNISLRRHAWIASGAIIIAIIYACVQLTYGLAPLLAERYVIAEDFKTKLNMFDYLMRGIALPLKIALCAFAYFLVMRFFETLHDVRKLQDSGIDERQDYLSSEGVLKLVGEKLTDNASADDDSDKANESLGQDAPGGFVNLVIKLPGENNKRIACILWPIEKRVKILDWVGTGKFSPLSIGDESESMSKALEWEKALGFVDEVLTKEERKKTVWPNDYIEERADTTQYMGNMKAIVNVVIEAHGAAIGCLQIARSEFNFSQMAIRQIREIANLISPSVQAYRELAGLDQMSIRFAERQAEETTYAPEKATLIITEILHDVFATFVTRFQMDFGFFAQKPVYLKREEGKSHFIQELVKSMKHEFDDKEWKKTPDHIVSNNVVYNLLKKQLTARVTETLSHNEFASEIPDRFITGNMVLAVNEKQDRYDQPTLGVTYLHRKAASTLASDAYLDFARDYYNGLLKGLGKKLSQKRHTIEDWFEPINEVLKEARLSWVVAGQTGKGKLLGDKEAAHIIENLKELSAKRNEILVGEIKIIHYALNNRQLDSSHVLKINLEGSDGFVWVGVERPGFSPELDFSSPWRTFLVNFAQIADAALTRITFPEKFQLQFEAAQLQGIISAVVTTQTVMHQLSNSIQGQSSSISTLIDALKLKKLRTDEEDIEQIMYAMKGSADRMQEMFQSFFRLTKMDDHRPCQLKEAARHASKLFELAMIRRQIDIEMSIPSDIQIDVPFNVAALALANLVGNATDAVSKNGKIAIEAERNGDFALCRVIDNGTGISPEMADKIFTPRVSSKKNGSGLGLYLTQHSLLENRASVELTSTGQTGTVFTVRFPSAN
jgi:signal transduction histidine kinase